MAPRRLLSGSALAITLALTACGGDNSTSDTSTTQMSTDAGSNDTGTDDTPADTSADGSSDVTTTVDANTASVDEIAAALAANGVANPERWAREVAEYRPYDTSDPSLGELRDELAKYNPDAATLEAIIASLTV